VLMFMQFPLIINFHYTKDAVFPKADYAS